MQAAREHSPPGRVSVQVWGIAHARSVDISLRYMEKVENRSMKREAYEALLAKLLNNELVAGEILNRRAVAQELGMSVAPVLEAMLQLENEGFFESIPRKGTQVRAIRREDVIGMAVVREALECQAARMYCGEPVKDAYDDLLPLARDLDQTAVGEPNHWEREIEFHAGLVGLAKCQMLSDEFRRCIRLNMFFAINKLYTGSASKDHQSHEELLSKLCTKDPENAETLIRGHVRSGKGELPAYLP